MRFRDYVGFRVEVSYEGFRVQVSGVEAYISTSPSSAMSSGLAACHVQAS